MATVTLNATEFQTYVSVEDADKYALGSRFNDVWSAFSDDDKARFLIEAYRLFNRQSWVWLPGEPSDVQLAALADASVEVGLLLAQGEDEVLTTSNTVNNIKRAKGGSAEVEYFEAEATAASRFPSVIQDLLGRYLGSAGSGYAPGSSVGGGGFVSGVDEVSTARHRSSFAWSS